eukprot:CAMPEP_0197527404 /NCGR_PEP_ID=MMETSP1318-20131121/21450_1 /TAXON_ID=552666 /ORGANISM="Partenskyella glossopodia, Strain RCC365" /LENGTH=127 /DNA_ID=CAMNT_0043082021 /DNA_START=247 /DNA_END=630 /DNA_ORIENTATION=-
MAAMLGLEEDDEEEEKETLTLDQYDMRVLQADAKQTALQTFIVGLIHTKWGAVIPMVVSVVVALINKPDNTLVRIYLRGETGSADLKRPFKKKSAFADMVAGAKTKKKKKEKGKGGKKARRKGAKEN